MATIAALDSVDQTLGALRLVQVDKLRGYEVPDPARVALIASSLLRTQRLVNPVVVDSERELIIDGHHRVEAFRWLGFRAIAAFCIDYGHERVVADQWLRSIDASVSSVIAVVRATGATLVAPWSVRVSGHNHFEDTAAGFATSLGAAESIDRTSRILEARGHSVRLVVQSQADALDDSPRPSPDRALMAMSPSVGKNDVERAASSGQRFPAQVNCHRIEGRPLGLRLPLTATRTEAAFEKALGDLRTAGAKDTPAAKAIDGRFYAERTLVFNPPSELST